MGLKGRLYASAIARIGDQPPLNERVLMSRAHARHDHVHNRPG